ncbi:MAG: PilZ domain-containing protein [Candidatus Omnitrophica bacterium]|nr:PilZ domain-containing protein [Candidatus Omnitrophota bacterium]
MLLPVSNRSINPMSSIAKKHWLIPVDKLGSIVTVVMADPLDTDAIKEVERLTNCKVQPFVGILSDIVKAIENYYGVKIEANALKWEEEAPLSLDEKSRGAVERRSSIRIKAKITVHFPVQDEYKKAETKDISSEGILFESANTLPIGSYVVLQIELPPERGAQPIAAVVQVVRAVPLPDKKFDIGARIIKIAKEDIDKIIEYAMELQ